MRRVIHCVIGMLFVMAIFTSDLDAASIENGSFESGDFSFWLIGGDDTYSGIDFQSAFDGLVGSFWGAPHPGNTLKQNILFSLPGRYLLQFAFAAIESDGAGGNYFSVSSGGLIVYELIDQGAFSYRVVFLYLDIPVAGLSELSFELSNNLGYWLLDDVKISSEPVPEPSFGAVSGVLGLACCVWGIVKRR